MNAYNGLEPYIFVSYSHKDVLLVQNVIKKLQMSGAHIWYDEKIDPADEWADTLAKKIQDASLFLLFISNNSILSHNVKREIYYAVNQNLPILSCVLEKVDYPAWLEFQIGLSQSVDFDEESIAEKLIKVFPDNCVSSLGTLIYDLRRFSYFFLADYGENSYSIIKFDKIVKKGIAIYNHKESNAFNADWFLNAVEFVPSNGFTENNVDTLIFQVVSDCNHDIGIGVSDMFFRIKFEIIDPDEFDSKICVIKAEKKEKNEDYIAGAEKHVLPKTYYSSVE